MEIELRSVEVGGQLVPLTGKYRQEGQGNTAATVGTIVAAGLIAGMFVTGHSAVFAQGTELRGWTVAPFAAVQPNPVARQQFAAAVAPAAAAQLATARPQVVLASASVAAPMPPTTSAPVAIMSPVAFHAAAPAVLPRAPLPIAYATASEDKEDQFARMLRAQQGVHGRDPRQGWTISD